MSSGSLLVLALCVLLGFLVFALGWCIGHPVTTEMNKTCIFNGYDKATWQLFAPAPVCAIDYTVPIEESAKHRVIITGD